jgi:hypothetical protein
LKQGAKSVEEYYQELQIGMLRCNLEEREDAAMARFFTGLNHEIDDILEYQELADVAATLGGGEDQHPPSNHDQRHHEKQTQAIAGAD